MGKNAINISMSIIGAPPVKNPSYESSKNRKSRKKLEEECIKVAKNTRQEYAFYGKAVKLTINYKRGDGKMDAANIIGGIADTLQGIFYRDDNQITEVYYQERPAKKRDGYEIVVETPQIR